MKNAGLGTFRLHSSRAASSTSALLMGMTLDNIISRVGWVRASTFIKYYMKPICHKASSKEMEQNKHVPSTSQSCTQGSAVADPHKFTGFIAQNSPRASRIHSLQVAKVQAFKDKYTSKPTKVYGPTPFSPLSPASTIGYEQDNDMVNQTLESNLPSDPINSIPDPFDFQSELALIQNEELSDERTRALADSLKVTQLEIMSRCLSPPAAFTDNIVNEECLPGEVDNDNIEVSGVQNTLDQGSHLDIVHTNAGDDPSTENTDLSTVLEQASQVLDNSSIFESVKLSSPNEVAGTQFVAPAPPCVPNSDVPSQNIALQSFVIDEKSKPCTISSPPAVVVPQGLVHIVHVIPQKMLNRKATNNYLDSGPRFTYNEAIAKLKSSGREVPEGAEVIHGSVHDDKTSRAKCNYAAGIEYLKTDDEKAKALVHKKPKKAKRPNVTHFADESSGFIKEVTVDSGPCKTFSKVDLASFGAALKQPNVPQSMTNKSLPTNKPKSPLSSQPVNNQPPPITEKMVIACESQSIPDPLFPDSSEITTIDWDCLKSVTMKDNVIDIRIPDDAVTTVKVAKPKIKKKGTKKTQPSTIDNSELTSGKQKIKSKAVSKKRTRCNSASAIKNNISENKNTSKVSDNTLNSLRGLIGAKIMHEKESLSTLETAFPAKISQDNMQMHQ